MGIGMCLYAQLVQTKKISMQECNYITVHHPHLSDFCCQPQLTEPYNHIIYPGVSKIEVSRVRAPVLRRRRSSAEGGVRVRATVLTVLYHLYHLFTVLCHLLSTPVQ